MITPALQPYMNTREDPAFRFLGVPTLMRSTSETTNGAFCLIEHWTIPPGFGSPYHVHHLEDESVLCPGRRNGVRLRWQMEQGRSGRLCVRATRNSARVQGDRCGPARM